MSRSSDPDLSIPLQEARATLERGDTREAERLIDRLIERARTALDPATEAAALLLSARLHVRVDNERATAHALRACAIGAALAVGALRAEGLLACARVSAAVGDFDVALQDLESALSIARAEHLDALEGAVLNQIGWVLSDMGQIEQSIEMHQQAVEAALREPSPYVALVARSCIASRQTDLAEAAWKRGHAAESIRLAEASLALHEALHGEARETGHRGVELNLLHSHAAALALLKRHDEALAMLDRHHALSQLLVRPYTQVRVALWRARVHRDAGRTAQCWSAIADGIRVGESLQSSMPLAALYEFASELGESEGDYRSALAHHKRFHAIRVACSGDLAEQRSKVLAVRLDTQRALARADDADRQAQLLAAANRHLTDQAASLTVRASTDSLTGFLNRGELDTRLARLHAEARAAGRPLCAAFLDLDRFKSINDDYSHATGDEVLRQVAALLRQELREGDMVGRYGGEEFVIVLPRLTLAQAEEVCERLRQSIERHLWHRLHPALKVTASLGLGDLALDAEVGAGLARVDGLLYLAKDRGRNRLCCA